MISPYKNYFIIEMKPPCQRRPWLDPAFIQIRIEGLNMIFLL